MLEGILYLRPILFIWVFKAIYLAKQRTNMGALVASWLLVGTPIQNYFRHPHDPISVALSTTVRTRRPRPWRRQLRRRRSETPRPREYSTAIHRPRMRLHRPWKRSRQRTKSAPSLRRQKADLPNVGRFGCAAPVCEFGLRLSSHPEPSCSVR